MISEILPDLVKAGAHLSEISHEALQPYFMLRKVRADIQSKDLLQESRHKQELKEAYHQMQLYSIYSYAFPMLPLEIKPQKIDPEWMYHFCDKAKYSSKEKMQILWAKILAGEINNPGSFSKITIQTLANLETSDADLFTRLCGFNFNFEGYDKIIHYDGFENIKDNFNGFLSEEELYHLEYLGLISYSDNGFITFDKVIVNVRYFEKDFQLVLADKKQHQLTTGYILLTKTGKELLPICGAEPFDDYLDILIESWKRKDIETANFSDRKLCT